MYHPLLIFLFSRSFIAGIIEKSEFEITESVIPGLNDRIFIIVQRFAEIKPLPLWATIGITILTVLAVLAASLFALKPLLREYIIRITLQSKRINEHFYSSSSVKKNNDNPKKSDIPVEDIITDDREIERIAGLVLMKLRAAESRKKEIQTNQRTSSSDKLKISEIMYCTEPRDGEAFDSKNLSERFIETESVFVFHLKNSNTAEFRVITDPDTMGRAIKYKKELLDTACDSLNSSINTRRIITKEPGIATRNGDRWIIKSKAKIKFE